MLPLWSWASVKWADQAHARGVEQPARHVPFASGSNRGQAGWKSCTKNAASHLDDGYIDISGPVAEVLQARKNEITFQLPSGPKRVEVQYAPAPDPSGQFDGMIAILILSTDGTVGWMSDTFHVWFGIAGLGLVTTRLGSLNESASSKAASMESIIKAPFWIEKKVRVF